MDLQGKRALCKIGHSIFAVLLVGTLVALAFSKSLDRLGESTTNELLVKSVVVYGTTRAVMAGLSFAEQLEVTIGLGVGTTIQPFSVVRPIYDYLERFSNVLLAAITSLAVLKLLTYIFGATGMSVVYACVSAACLVWYFYRPPKGPLFEYVPLRLFMMATVLRFAFVLIVGMNFLAHSVFLAERQTRAVETFNESAGAVEAITSEIATFGLGARETPQARGSNPVQPDTGDLRWYERLPGLGPDITQPAPQQSLPPPEDTPGFLERWRQRLSPAALLDALAERANAVVNAVIDVSVLFLLQGLLIPLTFMWIVFAVLKRLSP